MTKPNPQRVPRFRRSACWLSALALTLTSQACFHATGIQRNSPTAEEIPSSGGDRVAGPKSAAGPGDYFLGNDAVALAVDGLPYGSSGVPIAGAVSGGSIVDLGAIILDSSYKRTSMPTDMVERLTPVLNQDPNLQMVFDTFTVNNSGSSASLVMTGGVYDISAAQRLSGLSVTQTISLGESDHFFLVETTVTNTGSTTADVSSIGDYLIQKGGGFRLNIPAYADNSGNALSTWGVEIPGTSGFSPSASVRTTMVGLMGNEPCAPTYDAHTSLGILPVDEDYLLVACDAQTLDETRPVFPKNLVVGKPDVSGGLAAGASLTYRRRIYAEGGNSLQGAAGTKTYAYTYPNQATGLFNRMTKDRYVLRSSTSDGCGWVAFTPSGSMARFGGAPTEIRIEKTDGTLVRSEWLDPQEVLSSTYGNNPEIWMYLPVDTYRIVVQNDQPDQWSSSPTYLQTRFISDPFTEFYNTNDDDNPDVKVSLTVEKDPYTGDRTKSSDSDFIIGSAVICPEHNYVVTASNSVVDASYYQVSFYSLERNAPSGNLQPLRWTIKGDSVPDPVLKRVRSLGSVWDAAAKEKGVAGTNYGCYSFSEGNQAFGTAFKSGGPFSASLIKGDYTVYGTRGPLSILQSRDITVSTSSTNAYTFIIFPAGRPDGWTTFDMPGPSTATTGGLLPIEKLSGGLAEGIQVVANTEMDQLTESTELRDEFRDEIDRDAVSDEQRSAVGTDPYVVPARSSDLSSTGYGMVTALFTPDPTTARNKGARLPDSWTLSDFYKQAEGGYEVIMRPRKPTTGLFTVQDPSSVVKTTDDWLQGTGSHSYGLVNGDFDAIELLSGQALSDLGNPTDWFAEFLQVRADWFSLLNNQTPTAFTKALGFSSSTFTKDTPIGLARTYLNTVAYSNSTVDGSATNSGGFSQDDLSPIETALKSGAAVASTGPFVYGTISGSGPGALVTQSGSSVTVKVTAMIGDWLPLDQVRLVVNGTVVKTQAFGTSPASNGWTQDSSDTRKWTQSFGLTLSQDSWVVVESGVDLSTTGTYASGTPWNEIMRGIYPVSVANPIFVNIDGTGNYQKPGY
nr:hypothetical protein [uncultured Holophaga sp.]